MHEKRNLKRRHLIYYLRIFDDTNDKILGHLADINQEGCLVIGTNKIDTGKKFNMRMLLPDEILDSKDLKFSTTSKWSKKDVNPDFYVTGFKFDDFPSEKIAVLDKLIKNFGFND